MKRNDKMKENENAAAMLASFTKAVKERNEKQNSLKGKEAEKFGTELALYITKQTQLLMKEGLSVTAIQNSLRAAVDQVPQTYAPDADTIDDDDDRDDEYDYDNDDDDDEVQIHRRHPDGSSGELMTPLDDIVYMLPMEEKIIADFAAGKINVARFEEILCKARGITPFEMTEGLTLVLTSYGKQPALEEAALGGEIIADSDGEAFMPEYLDVRERDGYQFSICEPAVFKSPDEVERLRGLLEPFTEKEFAKEVNINKLVKAGWLAEYDRKSVKKAESFIKRGLWDEFTALREMYRRAAKDGKGIVLFVSYEHA